MFIVTFYSFKGGVGRSMALMNIAVEMARTGRKVLAVDFDLEAPGLDTFNLPRAKAAVPGIVDFVTDYAATGKAPDARDYMFRVDDIGKTPGQLWIMPSGLHDSEYNSKLGRLDWDELYREREGYLLFEDLKQQWKSSLDPDYVLIDSRTGYTDVAGICTRQLPDLVCIFFFPNEQNLNGLDSIVSGIANEAAEATRRPIELMYVMSNVPDIDDEDAILEESLRKFKRTLGFRNLTQTIHRYESLSLLNQVVFTKDRPRSRLAREYRSLMTEITKCNAEDREGALEYMTLLRKSRRRQALSEPVSTLDRRLQSIRDKHFGDGEVLYNVGIIKQSLMEVAEAEALFDMAIQNGYDKADALLSRALLRRDKGDKDGSSNDAEQVLRKPDINAHQARIAIDFIDREKLSTIIQSSALNNLPPRDRIWIATKLMTSPEDLHLADSILSEVEQTVSLSQEERRAAAAEHCLAYIGTGAFEKAIEILLSFEPDPARMPIRDAFNYAMAKWALDRRLPREIFEKVVLLDRSTSESQMGPNYVQCIALANWAIGRKEDALRLADNAKAMMLNVGFDFSCWRYQYVIEEQFRQDTDSMIAMIKGAAIVPTFFEAKSSSSQKGTKT